MSDKNKRKISFRLDGYLYNFINAWALERKIEVSEVVRSFCQNYYMDFMTSELKKKKLTPIEQKREKFFNLVNTIGVKDMKRVLQNPEICALMNGMMDNGRNNKPGKKEKPAKRVKAKK
jgi:hypothetical protein